MNTFLAIQYNNKVIIGVDSVACVEDIKDNTKNYEPKQFKNDDESEAELLTIGWESNNLLQKALKKYYRYENSVNGLTLIDKIFKDCFNEIVCQDVGGRNVLSEIELRIEYQPKMSL